MKTENEVQLDYREILIAYMCDVLRTKGDLFGSVTEYAVPALTAAECVALDECKAEALRICSGR